MLKLALTLLLLAGITFEASAQRQRTCTTTCYGNQCTTTCY
jgi:hypothetical protein